MKKAIAIVLILLGLGVLLRFGCQRQQTEPETTDENGAVIELSP